MPSYEDPYGETRGFGDVSDPDPGDPDSIAPRGTQAWRDAFNAHRSWLEGQVALKGGAGDAEKTKKIFEQLGMRNVKEKGMHAFTDAQEIANNARGMIEDAQGRQHWRGGAGGRPLEDYEMDSLRELTGWEGGNTNIPPEILRKWANSMAGGATGMGAGIPGQEARKRAEDTGMIGFYGNYSNPQSGSWGQRYYAGLDGSKGPNPRMTAAPGAGRTMAATASPMGYNAPTDYNAPASSSMGPPSAAPAPLASQTQNPVNTPNPIFGGFTPNPQGFMLRRKAMFTPAPQMGQTPGRNYGMIQTPQIRSGMGAGFGY